MISNEISSGHLNIVDHQTAERIIDEVLMDLASVKSTLGPCGRTNLIANQEDLNLYPSKDGYRIVMDMHYDDYFYDSIKKLVRDVSDYNNSMIGDGTTTAIVVLQEFYTKLRDLVVGHKDKFKYVSPTGVVNILKTLKGVIRKQLVQNGYIKYLKDYDKEVQKKIIRKVATVAANNDKTIGEYISKLFDNKIERGSYERLYADIAPSYTRETDESTEIGFKMPCGYINHIYATENDNKTAIYKDPKFLLIEGALLDGDIKTLWPVIQFVCLENQKPLVILADQYPVKVAEWLYWLRIGGTPLDVPTGKTNIDKDGNKFPEMKRITLPKLDIVPCQWCSDNDIGHERMIDLEVALGGKSIQARTEVWESYGDNPDQWAKILGSAEKVTVVPYQMSITGGNGSTSEIEARVDKIQEDLNKLAFGDTPIAAMEEADYKERISMLRSDMVSIRVGGASFTERKYNTLVYEDALYAINSTLQNGFTLAGQVSMHHLIKNHRESIVSDVIDILEREGRNVTFGSKRKEALVDAINGILDVIGDTFSTAYKCAINNAIVDEENLKEIFDKIYSSEKPIVYNLMTDAYEELTEESDMFVAGNSDYATFDGIVSIVSLFLNFDNLETLYIPRKLSSADLTAKQLMELGKQKDQKQIPGMM